MHTEQDYFIITKKHEIILKPDTTTCPLGSISPLFGRTQ